MACISSILVQICAGLVSMAYQGGCLQTVNDIWGHSQPAVTRFYSMCEYSRQVRFILFCDAANKDMF